MTSKLPSATDGFHRMNTSAARAGSRDATTGHAERIPLDEVLAIFHPDYPPMHVVKLVWDNSENLDIAAMRKRLREIASVLKAKPLNDAIDAMVVAVDEALSQLNTAPEGLSIAQATTLKDAALKLRSLLVSSRSET